MSYLAMLRCDSCGKPVLLLDDAQQRAVEDEPDRFVYVCTGCSDDGPGGFDPYADAGD